MTPCPPLARASHRGVPRKLQNRCQAWRTTRWPPLVRGPHGGARRVTSLAPSTRRPILASALAPRARGWNAAFARARLGGRIFRNLQGRLASRHLIGMFWWRNMLMRQLSALLACLVLVAFGIHASVFSGVKHSRKRGTDNDNHENSDEKKACTKQIQEHTPKVYMLIFI